MLVCLLHTGIVPRRKNIGKCCLHCEIEKTRTIDEVRMLPLIPSKGGSKSKFVIFVDKNQFKSNKLCYKVSLCENFQRHICSRTIPLSNGVYMLVVNVTLEPNI